MNHLVTTEALSGGDNASTLHITWQEPSLFPNGFVVTGIDINSRGVFFSFKKRIQSCKTILFCDL